MHIRDAVAAEFTEIGDIRAGAYLADGFLQPDSRYLPHLRALGADGAGTVLVAADRDDGKLLGTVMVQSWPQAGEIVRGPGEAEIRALAVRPEARGMGIGRALVTAVIDRARQRGVSNLLLLTQPAMRTAHRLYEEAGFTRLPERDWSPEPGITLLAYTLPLT